MISPAEAQELHELIGSSLEALKDGSRLRIAVLERARELAALIVSDNEEIERLREALERIYQEGRGPHVEIARAALNQ